MQQSEVDAGLISLGVAVCVSIFGYFKGKLNRTSAAVIDLQKQIVQYKTKDEADDRIVSQLSESLETISKDLAEFRIENVEAHGEIISGRVNLIERMTRVETRIADLSYHMPNGEIKDLIRSVDKIMEKLEIEK